MPSHCLSFSAILASLFLATRTAPPAARMRPRKSSMSATVRPAYCATTTTPELSKIWPSSLTTCSFRALSTVSLQFEEGRCPSGSVLPGNPGIRSSTLGPNSPARKRRFRLFHSIPVSGRVYASGPKAFGNPPSWTERRTGSGPPHSPPGCPEEGIPCVHVADSISTDTPGPIDELSEIFLTYFPLAPVGFARLTASTKARTFSASLASSKLTFPTPA